ncbi:Adenylate kinase [Rosistilla oblonga]|uniref:bifunctional aminoglycoside phosphotransferase/ATP-binding protein n=1 Tax=Rosistilla oblonga TaxID=2527990 RepID=UPI00118C187A|nr:bifunctional aminoglycoside phosphotransferase/ATP-binding protein [Rosistilla oblonga]QDV10310.1 Adenylate kinase [Rosistilla oblonga]
MQADSSGTNPDLIDALRSAEVYDDASGPPQEIQTHISFLFLTDAHVYKLKKSVDFGFLDYSTLAKRRAACQAEVELNRRLAADIYLGVVPVGRGTDGSWKIGDGVEPVEWLVKMRRLPDERCLTQMIQRDDWGDRDIAPIVAMLSGFYRGLPPVPMPNYAACYRQHVVDNGKELLDAKHRLPRALVRRVQAAQLQFMFLHGDALLQQRAADGHVVEGHGDLRAEHIYWTQTPVAIDCIEFSRELRLVDTADELSFFAMTCDDAGVPELGEAVLRRCCQALGDVPDPLLVAFYRCYRACVRAKVEALRSDQTAEASGSDSQPGAVRLIELADRYAQQLGNPPAVIVRGLSGTGKTTVAKALAERIGAVHLSTDALRKANSPDHDVNYDAQSRQQVYSAMFSEAVEHLQNRVPVVVDGTFLQADLLREAQQRLAAAGDKVVVATCVCPEEVAIDRIRQRQRRSDSLSDADETVYRQQVAQADRVSPSMAGIKVDTTADMPAILEEIRLGLV